MIAQTLLALAFAQSFGSITGTVVDPLRAVLPDAGVVLSQPARQVKIETRTDRQGQFDVIGLPAGEYQFEVSSPGFQVYRSTITIGADRVYRDVTLKIGTLQETITIRETTEPAPAPRPALAPRPNPPCSAAPATTTVGGNLRPPKKLRDVKPDYPAAFRGTGRDVTVVVDAVIGLDGFLKDFHVRQPQMPAFDAALITAIRDWQFDSTLLNCIPQEVEMTITATFQHQP